MTKLNALRGDPAYRAYIDKNAAAEADRVFCRHGEDHSMDVARVAWILFLEGADDCPELTACSREQARELLYAAAFVHDLGRFEEYADPERDHAAESARLAEPLLRRAGFDEAETALILSAVIRHRCRDGEGMARLLYRADKESRPCFRCTALAQCKRFKAGERPSVTI